MRSSLAPFIAAVFAVVTVAGCNCDRGLNRKTPEIVLSRTSVDFGTVQINLEHPEKVTVRNDGSASLTLSNPQIAAPFALKNELPLTIAIGQEEELIITYTPTVAGQIDEGSLTFHTDDPANLDPVISLRGQGITAVAQIAPNPVAFGDVYAGDSKQVKVKLTNAGSNSLSIVDVQLAPGTPAELTGDLSPLRVSLPPGGSSEATLTFAPQDILDLSTTLIFTFDPLAGGTVNVPVTGRGTRAIPRLCFQFTGQGTETCTDVVPVGGSSAGVNIPFGALCDNTITDGGCTALDGTKAGTLTLRNEGNVPLTYTGDWRQNLNPKSCGDAGFSRPDFQFSNSPDAGAQKFVTGTAGVPMAATDPKPWQTAPVTVSYSANSRCVEEAADSAAVFLATQSSGHLILMSVNFSGASALPDAEPSDLTANVSKTQLPAALGVVGAVNRGTAGFTVNLVTLHEVGADGGVGQDCAVTLPTSACDRFAWSPDGGDPNLRTPIYVGPDDGGVTPIVGVLLFGPDAGTDCTLGVCPNTAYELRAVIQTSDPYHPTVVSKIRATATP